MQINLNGALSPAEAASIPVNSPLIQSADAVFEEVKVYKSRILFWEKHYFSLMTAMRIMRMPIPMHFTMEFLEAEVLKVATATGQQAQIVRLVVGRDEPTDSPGNRVSYIILPVSSQNFLYTFAQSDAVVDLYKDFYVNASLLSGIKTTAQPARQLAAVFARENDFTDCLLVNDKKNVTDFVNGSLFLVYGNTIKTPPLSEGCRDEIIRAVLIEKIKKSALYTLEETPVSPFELQQADEMFSAHLYYGIKPISRYRKKDYGHETARFWLESLNETLQEMFA